MFTWLLGHWSAVLGNIGIVAGLVFSGFGFWRDARVRRAQTLIEITKLHRELWMFYAEHPEFAGLFDANRDMVACPLTDMEVRFANFLFLHLHGTYRAEKVGSYKQPTRLREDLREIFSHPATAAAWTKMRHLHDSDFVAYIEGFLAE